MADHTAGLQRGSHVIWGPFTWTQHSVHVTFSVVTDAPIGIFDSGFGGDARERYDVPVVEVIVPATRRAVSATRNGSIGVICTAATATSRAYDDAFAANPGVTLHTRACPRLVEFVETGVTSGPELLAAAQDYLQPLIDAGVDTLVLGCTHYPLLTGVLSYVMGDGVTLVSSAEETAKDVFALLLREHLERDAALPAPRHRFLTTGSPEEFRDLGRRFLGPEIESVDRLLTAAGVARVGA